jgi:hypothetical protein
MRKDNINILEDFKRVAPTLTLHLMHRIVDHFELKSNEKKEVKDKEEKMQPKPLVAQGEELDQIWRNFKQTNDINEKLIAGKRSAFTDEDLAFCASVLQPGVIPLHPSFESYSHEEKLNEIKKIGQNTWFSSVSNFFTPPPISSEEQAIQSLANSLHRWHTRDPKKFNWLSALNKGCELFGEHKKFYGYFDSKSLRIQSRLNTLHNRILRSPMEIVLTSQRPGFSYDREYDSGDLMESLLVLASHMDFILKLVLVRVIIGQDAPQKLSGNLKNLLASHCHDFLYGQYMQENMIRNYFSNYVLNLFDYIDLLSEEMLRSSHPTGFLRLVEVKQHLCALILDHAKSSYLEKMIIHQKIPVKIFPLRIQSQLGVKFLLQPEFERAIQESFIENYGILPSEDRVEYYSNRVRMPRFRQVEEGFFSNKVTKIGTPIWIGINELIKQLASQKARFTRPLTNDRYTGEKTLDEYSTRTYVTAPLPSWVKSLYYLIIDKEYFLASILISLEKKLPLSLIILINEYCMAAMVKIPASIEEERTEMEFSI